MELQVPVQAQRGPLEGLQDVSRWPRRERRHGPTASWPARAATRSQRSGAPAPKLAGVGRVGRIDLERHSPVAAVQTSNYFSHASVFVTTLPGLVKEEVS